MSATLEYPKASSSLAAALHPPLNAADRLMLIGHNGLRSIGHPGFICQSQAWLSARLDASALREALASLAERHPVVTARLATDPESGAPVWRVTGESCGLTEHSLPTDEDADVLRLAERLASTPLELQQSPPIEFHLAHRPGGRDVMFIRFSHALMDGKSPELALLEIDRLFRSPRCEWTPGAPGNELAQHLARFSRSHRLKSSMQVVRAQLRWPVMPTTMCPVAGPAWTTTEFRIGLRCLSESQTATLTERVRGLCGFVNLCPAVLASVFRAIARLTPRPIGRRTVLQTDVPLNLRPPGARVPIFRNFMSFISMSARADELADRDELTRRLSAQMRDQLRRGIDIGNLQMMSTMSRYDRLLAKHIIARMRKSPLSLAFGFLGPVAAGLEEFCGAPVERFVTLNAAVGPPGVTLQVNQFRGRLGLALSYVSDAVPEKLAEELLDTIMADLVA